MKFPWKGVAIGSGILVALVVIRCIVTLERSAYYSKAYSMSLVLQDPWLYAGIAAAAVCAAALLVLVDGKIRKEPKNEKDQDGCE